MDLRAVASLGLVVSFVACTFDWEQFDPRLAAGGGSSQGGGGSGGAGGEPPVIGGGGTSSQGGMGGGGMGGGGMGGDMGGGGMGGDAVGSGGAGGAVVQPPMCNGLVVTQLTSGVQVGGSTLQAPSQLEAGCASTTGGEAVYAMVLSTSASVVVTTDLPPTNYDTILYVRSVCESVATELGCDDVGAGDTVSLPNLPAGTYFVIVDSHTISGEGDFGLLATW
jgi:hypothetical protein